MVVVPIATTVDDLKRTHPLVKDGFYVSHRIYVEKMPEKYTIDPIPTRRTGGYDIETGKKISFDSLNLNLEEKKRRIPGHDKVHAQLLDFFSILLSSIQVLANISLSIILEE